MMRVTHLVRHGNHGYDHGYDHGYGHGRGCRRNYDACGSL